MEFTNNDLYNIEESLTLCYAKTRRSVSIEACKKCKELEILLNKIHSEMEKRGMNLDY